MHFSFHRSGYNIFILNEGRNPEGTDFAIAYLCKTVLTALSIIPTIFDISITETRQLLD